MVPTYHKCVVHVHSVCSYVSMVIILLEFYIINVYNTCEVYTHTHTTCEVYIYVCVYVCKTSLICKAVADEWIVLFV